MCICLLLLSPLMDVRVWCTKSKPLTSITTSFSWKLARSFVNSQFFSHSSFAYDGTTLMIFPRYRFFAAFFLSTYTPISVPQLVWLVLLTLLLLLLLKFCCDCRHCCFCCSFSQNYYILQFVHFAFHMLRKRFFFLHCFGKNMYKENKCLQLLDV